MPTRDTPWPNGTPCWVDYGAADLEAAKNFYSALFGWDYTGGDEEQYGGYINALKNGELAAGLGPRMDENQPVTWTTYFATDDSESTVRRIREAGGTIIVEPMDIAPYGRMTIALDPQGNSFGLWEAREHTGVRIYNEPGSLTWNEAAVDDPEAARAFYSAVFGYRFDEVPGAEGYTTFATEGNPLGGLGGHQPGSPKGWTTCFWVASTDDAVAMAESGGGKVAMAPRDTEFGRFAVLEDPWGAPFEVMQNLG
jgi:predicted enzyme related to lactoylglutathione lyase